jgi:hypothetical protein
MNLRKLTSDKYDMYDRIWGKPSQSNFVQRSMFMCFINLHVDHVQNILCKGHRSIWNILWGITFWNVGLGKKWFLYIFEVWIKEFYWNTINFNEIRCNSKALLSICLHFGMDKMYQRVSLLKKTLKKLYFSPFSPNFARRLWPGFPMDGHK